MKTILAVVTRTDRYQNTELKTGLWLSELTHLYHSARERGYEIVIASPRGGHTPLDPESLRPMMLDKLSKAYLGDEDFMKRLQQAKSLDEVTVRLYDCVYLAGGHGTMYDFPDDTALQTIVREHYENNRIVSAVCHGVCGLLNVRLSDGTYLVRGKKMTGFSWLEEILANRKNEVPFNLEAELKKRDANYRKGLLPLTSKVCEDGSLVTGQNPFSSRAIARRIIQRLEE